MLIADLIIAYVMGVILYPLACLLCIRPYYKGRLLLLTSHGIINESLMLGTNESVALSAFMYERYYRYTLIWPLFVVIKMLMSLSELFIKSSLSTKEEKLSKQEDWKPHHW